MIMSAPNGARRGPADHAALPLTPTALADCAVDLQAQGVSVLHLHVRNADGAHSLDPARYRAAIAAIRQRVGDRLVLQVTTEAVGRYTREEQMAVVRELRPEAVSLALPELCPDADAEPSAARFYAWLHRERIWPQHILYSADDVRRFETLRRRGLLGDDTPSCLLVLGRYAKNLEGDPNDLAEQLALLDTNAVSWTVCTFGRHENAAALAAAERGGHVRLGFENNLLLCDGTPARDNAELIAQFRRSMSHLHRRPATADEIRARWQIKQ